MPPARALTWSKATLLDEILDECPKCLGWANRAVFGWWPRTDDPPPGAFLVLTCSVEEDLFCTTCDG